MRRLMLSAAPAAILSFGLVPPAVANEPAMALPDALWDEPLFPDAEAEVTEPLRFLPPLVLTDEAQPSVAVAEPRRPPPAPAAPYVAVGGDGAARVPTVTFPEGVLPGPPVVLNPDGAARVTIIPELGSVPSFGTTVRGGGISVQGGTPGLGVGVGVSRDQDGRTSGGLGVTFSFP